MFDSFLNLLDGEEIIKKLDDAAAAVEKFAETAEEKLAIAEEKAEAAGGSLEKVADKLPATE